MNPCKQIRQRILEIAYESGHGHIPSCFSVVEILYAVYSTMGEDDVFILSKGHAALAQYCVMEHFGLLKVENFGAFGSRFGCHPDRSKTPVYASTGSLGHGLGIGVGVALGKWIKQEKGRVYVLIGDGEANEGSVWEAVMVASNLNLSNITILYDNNMSQTRGLQLPAPGLIFDAFDHETVGVDGHSVSSLLEALDCRHEAVMCHTMKGYPSHTLVSNMHEWHRRSPNDAEYESLLGEI